MINREHSLPLSQQCRLLALSRSSLYYEAAQESVLDMELMRLIDEIHMKYPDYGSRRIQDELEDLGHVVGRGHIRTTYKSHFAVQTNPTTSSSNQLRAPE